MGKSIQELAAELKDEVLPTAGQDLEDLPIFGSFTPPPPPGAYRFQLPGDMSSIWDVIETPHLTPGQRIKAGFDRDHPLLIIQSPQGKSNGEPFETRLTNTERGRGKDRAPASDMDYLLRAFGAKSKPRGNSEYMRAVVAHAGKQFSADLRYSWRCSKDRDIRARDSAGQIQVVDGKKGCGASFYQEDVPRNAAGEVPYEIECGECGASLRAFANLDNIRA